MEAIFLGTVDVPGWIAILGWLSMLGWLAWAIRASMRTKR